MASSLVSALRAYQLLYLFTSAGALFLISHRRIPVRRYYYV
jgi:hypothetical protein